MIKRILLTLDLDAETPVCTRYAVEMARQHDAEITGLALVDIEHISDEGRGGGIGSMYFAEKLKANLTEETRRHAQELLSAFHQQMEAEGVTFHCNVEVGKDIGIRKLERDHDAVLLAGGSEKPRDLDDLWAHADADEILRWLHTFRTPPRQVYLVHGEPKAQDALKARLEADFGWPVHIPLHGETIDVTL